MCRPADVGPNSRILLHQARHRHLREVAVGVIDWAKGFRAKAVDRLHPQRVVFHHVPKCGGTSVGRAIRKKYLLSQATIRPNASFRAYAAFIGSDDTEAVLKGVFDLREQMLLYLLFEDVRCVSAHVHFSETAYKLFHESYKFITILREPVSRFVSNYRWSRHRPDDHSYIDESFEAYLASNRARQDGAMYVQYFSGLPGGADIRAPEAIGAAKRNLDRFDVVGLLHDIDGFTAKLESELGLHVRIGHENKQKNRDGGGASALDPATRAEVERLCAPDLEIWRHVTANAHG